MLAFANQPIKSQSLISENNIVISGKITDKSSGKAIARSSILFKGTSVGTIADDNGHYQIKAKSPNDELLVSHIGYQTQIITVGSKSEINIEMEPIPLTITFPQKNKTTDNAKIETYHKEAPQNTKIVAIEMLPTYPGGNEALQSYLASNLQYPENDKSKGIQGRVWVSCTVGVNGEITNTKVLRGVSPDINKEAIRLAGSMTGWKPASQNGSKTAMKVITGSGYYVDPRALGYSMCTYIGITLEKGSMYKEVVPKLEEIPEIVECTYTLGPYSLLIKMYAKNPEHLLELLNGRIQEIDGIVATETLTVLDQRILRQIPILKDE